MSGNRPHGDEDNAASSSSSSKASPFPESMASGGTRRQQELLREILPACQPQEGSPANTFTVSELQELQAALQQSPDGTDAAAAASVVNGKEEQEDAVMAAADAVNKLDIRGPWLPLPDPNTKKQAPGAFRLLPRAFRQAVRTGAFGGPTNGACPGYLQCNLVVLPAGKVAFDFLLFCQRNSKACPLLEVCDGASSFAPQRLAQGADLRTDLPKYAIYRDGALQEVVADCTNFWPENAVAFLIGCSFSYDAALLAAGIPLRSAEAGKNVPMYKTNVACEPAGSLRGHMVVSMKPVPGTLVAREVEITSRYAHAHGGPVCVGCPAALGIGRLDKPDWGDPIDVRPGEIPVFHACGVTPQAVLAASKVPFAITHAAGHMFVTDSPSDMGLL